MAKRSRSSVTSKTNKNPNKVEKSENNNIDVDNDNIISNDKDDEFIIHDDLSSTDLPKSTDFVLKQFLDRCDIEEEYYSVTLRKFDKPSGKNSSIIDQWEDEILSEHEIGIKYGPGRYILIINAKDKNGKDRVGSKRIKLHDRYQKLHEEYLLTGGNLYTKENVVSNPINNNSFGNDPISQSLNIMRQMMSMFLPLITAQNNKNQDPGEMMAGVYKSINSAMKNSLLDNTQMFNDMQRKVLSMEPVYETEEEVTGVKSLIETIAPLLENVLPLILGGGKTSGATIGMVQKTAQYQALVKSKAHVKGLVEYIEGKHGKEVTEKLLDKFKIKRPK